MLKALFKIQFVSFIFFIGFAVQGQNLDTLTSINNKYDSLLRSDSESMNRLFYKHNNDALINNLGPFGSPFYYPTAFSMFNYNLIEKENVFNKLLFQLRGFKPFTNITYINASRKEQQFSVNHIQQFGKLLFFDFNFNKLSSPGTYINQEANNTTFKGALKYESKKENYEIEFLNEIYRNFYQENGGLKRIKNYEESLFDDERNYEVNLLNSNSFFKKYVYQLNQRLDLFNFGIDSSTSKTVYLKHKINYTTQKKVFFDNDPTSEIYKEMYLDTISSIDSIYENNLSNIGFIGFRTSTYSIELFGQYDQKEYLQSFGMNANFHNGYVGFSGSYKYQFLLLEAIAKYGISGYRSGDVESEVLLSYMRTNYNLEGKISYFLNEPNYKFVNYTSNHFIWNNTFDKQSLVDIGLNIKSEKYNLEFKTENKILTNTLYYDSLANASQNNETASISSFSLAKNYRVLNFHFRTAVIYQLTSDEVLFPLPDLIGRQVLYYQKYIFKKALKFQLGVGFSYSTAFYGYAYMPALNEFYVQENTQLGYYPQVDIFINTHLKRAQIFLKYEHINSGRSLHKSYSAPSYPFLSKSLKFGVSWNMFD